MRINPNSSIRSGYKFEDLFVMQLCFNWLKNPKLYKEIKIQYVPDEVNTNKFFLDDVVAIGQRNRTYFYQLKHKQNPEVDQWTFSTLLDNNGKKIPLLEKWIKSFESVNDGSAGYFITNGYPSNDISACLQGNKLVLSKVAELYPSEYKKIQSFFNNDFAAVKFFNLFSFEFEYSDKNTLEKELRILYNRELNVTKAGFDNLLIYILNQGSEKYPKALNLETIRKLLEWYTPRPLKQNFEIPQDFELFDDIKHQHFLDDLQNARGGIKVILGKPGVGKSTYLSNLHSFLNSQKEIQSIRHHYHLNTKDNSYYERLDASRAIEALKAEFRKLSDEQLGDLAYQNLHSTPIRDLLNAVAQHYYQQNKTFILIIDGLDHVIRERKSEKELLAFLDEVLYPQQGLWIILGTQEMALPHFRNIIHNHAPKNTWIEIKGLSKQSVKEIILKNTTGLSLPREIFNLNDLADAIYEITSGNALHLRYVLSQLKLNKNPVTRASVRSILPYKDEIANYYSDLWRQIPPISKTFALAITLLNCKLREDDIYEFGSYLTKIPSEISQCFDNIKHLLRIDISGISVYHNSFLVFIANQIELEQQKRALYLKSRQWLKNTTNSYLKWLLFPQIEYRLGNPNPLLSINRKWVIESYLLCRNEVQITSILQLAAEAAFKSEDFSKVMLFRIFASCIDEREYNLHEAIPKIWNLAFKTRAKNELSYPDIDNLDAYQIKNHLIALAKRGVLLNIPEEVYDRFNELIKYNKTYNSEEVIGHWLELLAYFDKDKSTKEIHKFILQFRDNFNIGEQLSTYILMLLSLGKVNKVEELLELSFATSEKEDIAVSIAKYNLEHDTEYGIRFISNVADEVNNYSINFYLLIKNNRSPQLNKLPDGKLFPTELEYHGTSKSAETLNLYLDSFLQSLAYNLSNKGSNVETWLTAQDDRWSISAMRCLVNVSKVLANSLLDKSKIDYSELIDIFESLRLLDFREDYEIYELQRAILPTCIIKILELSILINKKNKTDFSYTESHITKLKKCKWLYSSTIVTHLLGFNTPPISLGALRLLIQNGVDAIRTSIEPFKDKADTLVNFSLLAFKCNEKELSKELLLKASNNIISYGYHKDMYLYSILQGIDICAKAGSTKIFDYLKKVSPFIHNVDDYTDGDETGSFIYELATLYGKYKPDWLYKLYIKSVYEQDYYKSDSFFADIISIIQLPNQVNSALFNTAIDQSSYNTVIFRSKTESAAKQELNNIRKKFGNIDYNSNRITDTNYKHKKDRQPNYSKVKPNNLEVYIQKIRGKEFQLREYAQKKYLTEWLHHWIINSTNHDEIFLTVKEIIKNNLDNTSPETLKLFYPLALVRDREFAFECLVWSHANDSIWSSTYMRSFELSKEMWNTVIKDFPDRLNEYFEKTIFNTGVYYDRGELYFVPIPKSIAYFIDCNQLSKAEEILENAIKHLHELTPDTTFPNLEYLETQKPIDGFDILLVRLVWLNPVVREISAYNIASLLSTDIEGIYHNRFLKWLSNQKLEAVISYGLIVILKSLNDKHSCSKKHIIAKELYDILQAKTATLFILINLIFEKLNYYNQELYYDTNVDITIKPVSELERFKYNIGRQIQFIFTQTCETLERKTGFEVFNLWALIYEAKKNELNLPHGQHVDDFCNTSREYMMARTTILSDILRSSFMVVLDYLFQNKYINQGDLFFHVFQLLPIDISIWKIDIGSQPKWWPKFIASSKEGASAILTSDLMTSIQKIIHPVDGWRLFYLNGLVIPIDGYYNSLLNGHLKILPFAYKVIGDKIPTDKEIFNVVSDFASYFPTGNDFNFFDNPIAYNSKYDFPIQKGDVMLFPLLAHVHSLSGNSWQYYRMFGSFMLPIPHVSDDLTLSITNGKLRYLNSNKNVIYKSNDFLFGLRDRFQRGDDLPYGRYLLVKDNYIENIISNQGLKLGYICKTVYKTRKHSFDKVPNEAIFYELINFSRLIT